VRRSFAVADYLVYNLQHTNKRIHLVSGLGGSYREQMRSVRANDLVIAISFTPYGKETQHCLRIAQHHQAKTLIITDRISRPWPSAPTPYCWSMKAVRLRSVH